MAIHHFNFRTVYKETKYDNTCEIIMTNTRLVSILLRFHTVFRATSWTSGAVTILSRRSDFSCWSRSRIWVLPQLNSDQALKLLCLKGHVGARASTLWWHRWQEASEFLCTETPLWKKTVSPRSHTTTQHIYIYILCAHIRIHLYRDLVHLDSSVPPCVSSRPGLGSHDDDCLCYHPLEKCCSIWFWNSVVFSYLASRSERRRLRCLFFCRWWKIENLHVDPALLVWSSTLVSTHAPLHP